MRRAGLLALVLAAALSVAAAGAPFRPTEPIMPLSQVRAGMKGYGRTVFLGNTVKSFPVEILGVVSKKDRPSKLILIRASGPDIDKAGGLATGMSGTPVYVDGRLLGAFSFGWDFGDPRMGLVTPIEEMCTLFDHAGLDLTPPKVKRERTREERLLDRRFNDLYERRLGSAAKDAGDDEVELSPGEAEGEKLPRLLYSASGISRRAMKSLERRLGARVIEGGSQENHALPDQPPPQPGESISALLAWGDAALDVSGTLTAADANGRFVAFGHPFKNWGAVAYPVARATVHGIVNSYESPFKLTSAGNIAGMVTQDRPEGVAGYFGRFAPAVSVRLEVEDRDTGKTTVRRFQMISDEHAVATLLPELLTGLADRELDRQAGGTARWDVRFSGAGIPDGWSYGDVTASDEDVMAEVINPVSEIVETFAENPYQPLGAFGLKVKIAATTRKRLLLIESVSLDSAEAAAGSEVPVKVTLRPWRGQPQTRAFTLHVPPDASGPCTVTVRAGNPHADDGEGAPSASREHSSLSQMLRGLSSRERACEVVVELTGQDEPAASQPESAAESRRRRLREGSLLIFNSDYVVDGTVQTPLTVMRPKRAKR